MLQVWVPFVRSIKEEKFRSDWVNVLDLLCYKIFSGGKDILVKNNSR